jgi:hypothetical protein
LPEVAGIVATIDNRAVTTVVFSSNINAGEPWSLPDLSRSFFI